MIVIIAEQLVFLETLLEPVNRAAYRPRGRELAQVWADLLSAGLPPSTVLVDRRSKLTGDHSRRRFPAPIPATFAFP
ncbi:hypothetical protein ACLB0R_04700 [Sphingomonas sp. GlSt437]|uniref:hypothetical protein n=1 Tax=Sphingomonas sp. GlSt437 TaxID=3389970 RepID=UPI003A8A88E4